jgi:PKD repeat protein
VGATDQDGDSLTYSATGAPVGASFNTNTRTFSWTPSVTQAGTYQVTFRVTDGSLTDSETVTITVSSINHPPVLGNIGSRTVAEESPLSFTINATDSDGDSLTYSAT